MKRIVVMLAVLLVAAAAFAQSNQVLSRNAVGYVKATAERDGLQLVSLTFESLDGGDMYATDVVGTQLPAGSTLYIWNSASNKYDSESLPLRGGWPDIYAINPGVGFWMSVPGTAASNTYDVFMMGEVPAETNFTLTIPNSFTCVGYSYPVSTLWTGTEAAITLDAGSTIYLWSGSNYVSHSKSLRGGWATATNLYLEPGAGFWINNVGASFDWDQTKPYTWP